MDSESFFPTLGAGTILFYFGDYKYIGPGANK